MLKPSRLSIHIAILLSISGCVLTPRPSPPNISELISTSTFTPEFTARHTDLPTPTKTSKPTATTPPTITPAPEPEYICYHITYSIILDKYRGLTKIWMPVPVNWDTQTNTRMIGFSPSPNDLYLDPEGNQIVYWQQTLKKGTEYTFSEEFEFCNLKKIWKVDLNDVGVYDDSDAEVLSYLGSTEYIQTTDPDIQATAKKVVGSETNPYTMARLIYKFVVSNARGNGSENKAAECLKTGLCSCGGSAHLFVALSRASGIPARIVAGIWGLKEGKYNWRVNNFGTHMWAEFYLPNYGWIPADPSGGSSPDGGKGFAVSQGDRLILSKGNNNIQLGHGIDPVSWFHMPYVNNDQEEGQALLLEVRNIGK